MHLIILTGITYIKKVSDFLNKINEIASESEVLIQAMNSNMIAGYEHVMYAIEKANKSFETNKNVAKDKGIEIMRYAAAKKQIEDAFSLGIAEGNNNILLIVLGNEKDTLKAYNELKKTVTEKDLLEYTAEKKFYIMQQFKITLEELNVVGEDKIPKLVKERVALVDYIN